MTDSPVAWRTWGLQGDRYRTSGRRRLLALDGGGIRGILALKVLFRLDELLSRRSGSLAFRLFDYFDYIAGTSTGAIIAVGRCVHGGAIDSELGDLIPRDGQGRPIPLSQDLGRSFLYVRYNAELTRTWLDEHGLEHLDPVALARLDAIDQIDGLSEVGDKVAEGVDLTHFGNFA